MTYDNISKSYFIDDFFVPQKTARLNRNSVTSKNNYVIIELLCHHCYMIMYDIYMIIHDHTWSYMIIHDHIYISYMIIHDHILYMIISLPKTDESVGTFDRDPSSNLVVTIERLKGLIWKFWPGVAGRSLLTLPVWLSWSKTTCDPIK